MNITEPFVWGNLGELYGPRLQLVPLYSLARRCVLNLNEEAQTKLFSVL